MGDAFIFGLLSCYLMIISDCLVDGYFLHVINNYIALLIGLKENIIYDHKFFASILYIFIVYEIIIDIFWIISMYIKLNTKIKKE